MNYKIEDKKKIVDSWFEYLQIQISSQFQKIEDDMSKRSKKFKSNFWTKKNNIEGGGKSLILENGNVFDKKTNPVWFDTANVIRGFRYGLQYFSPGNFTQRENGTIDFNQFGRGLIFMPSGLGYFNSAQTNILVKYTKLKSPYVMTNESNIIISTKKAIPR